MKENKRKITPKTNNNLHVSVHSHSLCISFHTAIRQSSHVELLNNRECEDLSHTYTSNMFTFTHLSWAISQYAFHSQFRQISGQFFSDYYIFLVSIHSPFFVKASQTEFTSDCLCCYLSFCPFVVVTSESKRFDRVNFFSTQLSECLLSSRVLNSVTDTLIQNTLCKRNCYSNSNYTIQIISLK